MGAALEHDHLAPPDPVHYSAGGFVQTATRPDTEPPG
jgi:hypothetical protein